MIANETISDRPFEERLDHGKTTEHEITVKLRDKGRSVTKATPEQDRTEGIDAFVNSKPTQYKGRESRSGNHIPLEVCKHFHGRFYLDLEWGRDYTSRAELYLCLTGHRLWEMKKYDMMNLVNPLLEIYMKRCSEDERPEEERFPETFEDPMVRGVQLQWTNDPKDGHRKLLAYLDPKRVGAELIWTDQET